MRQLELSYPWGTSNITVVERPDPEAGAGQVVVRMRAASLNFRDTIIAAQGGYGRGGPDAPPVIPFSDGCGVVEAVGGGVTRVAVGDRVATQFFPNWEAGHPSPEKAAGALGSPGAPGAGRDLALFPEGAVARVPDYLTDEEVACLPCAALTAWRALFVDADLSPGDTVVLQGTGGVSIFGLQFAHAAGLRTIVTSSSDDKLARARDLGANYLVNYRTTTEWSRAVREATGGRGADFVMEVGGANTLIESLKSVRMGGHVAVIGVVSDVASPGATLSPGIMIATSARLVGVSVGSREMFAEMCRAMELWQLRPVISRTYDWTEAGLAIDDLVQGQHFGKVVLTF